MAVPNATCVDIALLSGADQLSGITVEDDGRENIFQVCSSEAEPSPCPGESNRAVWIAEGECAATFAQGLEVSGDRCITTAEGIRCNLLPGSMHFIPAIRMQCCGPSRSCGARCAPEEWSWTCSECNPEEPLTKTEMAIHGVYTLVAGLFVMALLVLLCLLCTRPGRELLALFLVWWGCRKLSNANDQNQRQDAPQNPAVNGPPPLTLPAADGR